MKSAFQRMARGLLRASVLAASAWVAGALCVQAQEAEECGRGAVLGEMDLADRAEISRNLYRRMTPGDGTLVQDVGTWPAAWEEFGASWDDAAAEREFGAWTVPVSVTLENGATVVRDGTGRELWRGETDFARAESAGVVLTGALVGEEDWAGYEAVKEFVEANTRLEAASPMGAPPRSGATNGLRFTSAAVDTNGTVELSLAWEQDGEVDIFAYGVPHDPAIRILTWTNDENTVVTTTNTISTRAGANLTGYDNDWEWRGTVAVTNGEGFFADEDIPDYLGIVRFYAAAEAADSDGDGLNDGVERFVLHTDLESQDTDGDGVPDGSDPYPVASNVFWTVTTTNTYLRHYPRPNCAQNAPAVHVATEDVVGVRPAADSVVHDVNVTGFVDDAIQVDGTGVDWRRDIHEFDHRSITDEIADLQGGEFELELWDWPRADYEGPNEARLGDANGVPFKVEWTWKVPVEVTGPDFLCLGDSAQMGVSWEDGGPYSWSVSGPAASIDASGMLSAITTGVATVTASNAAGWTVEKDVTVVRIGAIALDPADVQSVLLATSGGTATIATVKGTGKVSLLATIEPDTAETRGWISWQGAVPDAANPLKATLERDAAGKREVAIRAGGESRQQADVWVVWCEFTEFNTTGPTPADSEVSPPAYGVSAGLQNGMLLQCSIVPQGFWNVSGVQYDIKRTKERATWMLRSSGWEQASHVGPGADDDGTNGDEDLTPSSDGRIYSMDYPGFQLTSAPVEEAVYKASFVEFTTIKLGSGSWTVCSDNFEWHSITWAENDGTGNLVRKSGAPNEIGAGSIPVGTAQDPHAGNAGTGGGT